MKRHCPHCDTETEPANPRSPFWCKECCKEYPPERKPHCPRCQIHLVDATVPKCPHCFVEIAPYLERQAAGDPDALPLCECGEPRKIDARYCKDCTCNDCKNGKVYSNKRNRWVDCEECKGTCTQFRRTRDGKWTLRGA